MEFIEDAAASARCLVADDVFREHHATNRSGCAARTKIVFVDSDDEADPAQHGPSVVPVDHEYQLEMDEEAMVDETLVVAQSVVDGFFEDASCGIVPDGDAPVRQRTVAIPHDPQLQNIPHNNMTAYARAQRRNALDLENAIAVRKRFREDDETDQTETGRGTEETSGPVEGSDVQEDIIGVLQLQTRVGQLDAGADGANSTTVDDASESTTHTGVAVARVIDGYRFTLDENDLQDTFPEDEDEEDEEEDEEDDGLDDLVVVSAVEQLVRCCEEESEEVPQYKVFMDKAKAQLAALYAKEQTLQEFAGHMSGEVLHLQRVFRRVSRPPRDAPIIVDGVVMDM